MLAQLVFLAVKFAVEGSSACPTPAQVAERVQQISPVEEGETRRVVLEEVGGQLRISLLSGSGQPLTSRTLSPSGSCDEMADAASVVIGSWLSQPPQVSPPELKLPQAVPIAAPVAERDTKPRARFAAEVGGAFIAAFAGARFAPGGALDLSLGSTRSHFAGRISIFGTANRQVGLTPGHVDFTRIGTSLGPEARFRFRRLVLVLHAEVLLAFLRTEGVGFVHDHGGDALDPGFSAGIRIGAHVGRFTPFIGFDFAGWIRPEVVADGASSAELPRWDALLAIGVAIGTFP